MSVLLSLMLSYHNNFSSCWLSYVDRVCLSLCIPRSHNRDLTRGQRLEKNMFLFTWNFAFIWNYPLCLSVLKLVLRIMRRIPNRNTKYEPLRFTFVRQRRVWFFQVILQTAAEKSTKDHNARSKPLGFAH